MKKILSIAALVALLTVSTTQVFAANKVSNMATTKGGQHVAHCAQMMDRGVSCCARHLECEKGCN